MKAKAKSLRLLALWPAALFLLTSCSTTSEPSPAVGAAVVTYKKGVPGGVLVQTDKLTATVTAIDPANHTATLQGAGGKHFTVKVGRKAVNFHQVRVGDKVTVTLTQKAVVTVNDQAASSGAGPQPGGLAAETLQLTAKIIATDPDKHTATLQFEDGSTQTYTRADVDMTRLHLGQQVIFRVIEMTAIWIEKTTDH
jgi:hypothetical protein